MIEWIISVMSSGGYPVLGGLMFLENLFPPIPSEIVMPLAGFLAAQGRFGLVTTIAVGTVGTVLGAYFWYWIGQRVGERRLRAFTERHGRWLTLTPEDVDRASAWFRRHGAWAVCVGRFIPGIRTLISVPAGVSNMPLVPFLIYSTLGSLVWISGLTLLGYALEAQYQKVSSWLDPLSWLVLAGFVAWYLWRLLRQERH